MTLSVKALCYVFSLSVCMSVCSFVQTLLPHSLMNALNSFVETYVEYSLAPTDDLVRFWRSKVKVTAGVKGVKSSSSMLGRQSPS